MAHSPPMSQCRMPQVATRSHGAAVAVGDPGRRVLAQLAEQRQHAGQQRDNSGHRRHRRLHAPVDGDIAERRARLSDRGRGAPAASMRPGADRRRIPTLARRNVSTICSRTMAARPPPSAARSDHLGPSRRDLRQRQVGQVGARNQHERDDAAEQREQAGPPRTELRLAKAGDARRPPGQRRRRLGDDPCMRASSSDSSCATVAVGVEPRERLDEGGERGEPGF